MTEYSTKWERQPGRRLVITLALGLLLAGVAIAWPTAVLGDSAPVITQVIITSSSGTFFYSPPLTELGGSVYFNNLNGEGADQILSVTATVSDVNPTTFSGGFAFGIAPTTSISTSYGITSTWTVTYTIHASDASQNGVVFTISDSTDLHDTFTVNFVRDVDDPTLNVVGGIVENSPYLYAVGSTGIYYGDDMSSAVPFTIAGTAQDTGVGLKRATFSPALGESPPDDNTPAAWEVVYSADSTNTDQGSITVSVYDRVGNVTARSFFYTRDTQAPSSPPSFTQVPDTDSGADGFAPDTGWEDDLTANFTWSAGSDPGGSGVAGYRLTSSPPVVPAFYSGTSGSLTVGQDGNYAISVYPIDNVGNEDTTGSTRSITFDRTAPANGNLTVAELTGGQYLFIAPNAAITSGTLFYNNAASSSFRVTANTPPDFVWGGSNSLFWKVAFSPGWGESSISVDVTPGYDHIYSVDPSETTSLFTIYYINRAGNVLSIPINAELDTTGPTLAFATIPPPDWNNSGDYWYRTGGLTSGWGFSTDVHDNKAGVDPSVGWAYWDHSVGTADDQNKSAPGGAATFTGVSDDPDGQVTVTVVLTDRVNNPNNISMTLNLDGTPPSITPSGWSESSNYLQVAAGQLFFSHMMPGDQSATLSGSAADNSGGSGLDYATFSSEPNLAGSPPDDLSPAAWAGTYTFASSSSQGDGQAVVTVYDHVGNSAMTGFTYVEDVTPPTVTLLNVTDPGYDPDGDELDDADNWYTSNNLRDGPGSDGWAFFFSHSETQSGERAARADWDHSNNTYDQLGYDPGLDVTGVFGTGVDSSGAAVNNDADGVVTVTLRVEDNVGNVGSDHLTLRIDNTPPAITSGAWSEGSQFLYTDGSTLYFGHQMPTSQQATLNGQASDGTGSGLSIMSFSNEPNLAGSPGPDVTPDNWSGVYAFNNTNSQGDGSVLVTLNDHLGHITTKTYNYVLDAVAPTAPGNFRIDTPPVTGNYYNTQSLSLSWNASTDNASGSGLLGYYLGTSDPPSDLELPSATSTPFDTGADGAFTFYLEARDKVRNVSLVSTGPITIDTVGPVSFVTASPEEASRRFLVEWGADDVTTWPVSYDVEYRVNGGSWTSWLAATSLTSQYFGPDSPVHVETGDFYEFRVQARDYVNNQGEWSRPWGGSVTRRFVFLPIIINNYDASIPFAVFDGFETGQFVGWKTSGALPSSIVTNPLPPNGGSYAALLGSPGYGCGDSPTVPIGQASLQAYVRVPASGTPYLRFNYRVRSYDTVRNSSGEWWDRLEVRVNSDVLQRYGDPDPGNLNCANLYDSGWNGAEFNLSAYKGQTVVLTFFNENHGDRYWNTYSYLDNIRVEVGP
jgi:hypothetical protein